MMGTFRVRGQVFSLTNPGLGHGIEMLVDTGATQSIIPRTVLEDLSVPVVRRQTFRLANGEEIHRDVGWVGVRPRGGRRTRWRCLGSRRMPRSSGPSRSRNSGWRLILAKGC